MSEKIVRFNLAQRLEHFAIMSLFTILTVTGFPQKYWSAGWAQSFSAAVGGVETLRLVHRASGILFSVLCVYHLVYVSFFSLTGRFKLTICTNLPCALQGATEAAEHLKERLGVGFNETTGDGLFTLREGECMGACGDAPVVLVNNKRMCVKMMPTALDALVDELAAAAPVAREPEAR